MANILILEDDVDLATQWSMALSERDHRVELAVDVAEAMSHVEDTEFDLVIVDFFIRQLKGYSNKGGLTLISKLRVPDANNHSKWRQTVPILSVTGAQPLGSGFDPLKTAEMLGSTKGLRKPIMVDHLVFWAEELMLTHEG